MIDFQKPTLTKQKRGRFPVQVVFLLLSICIFAFVHLYLCSEVACAALMNEFGRVGTHWSGLDAHIAGSSRKMQNMEKMDNYVFATEGGRARLGWKHKMDKVDNCKRNMRSLENKTKTPASHQIHIFSSKSQVMVQQCC